MGAKCNEWYAMVKRFTWEMRQPMRREMMREENLKEGKEVYVVTASCKFFRMLSIFASASWLSSAESSSSYNCWLVESSLLALPRSSLAIGQNAVSVVIVVECTSVHEELKAYSRMSAGMGVSLVAFWAIFVVEKVGGARRAWDGGNRGFLHGEHRRVEAELKNRR